MKKHLREGMRAGDLQDLVLPLISVDEFESKINDDAIVFGFYVNDQDAARDLNRFIQKSPAAIIDTEVSPAPDQRGYYVVFFEVLGSARLPGIVSQVIDEVSPLVDVEEWQMQIRGQDDLISFSENVLARYMKRIEKEDSKKENVEEQVLSFLHKSGLSGLRMDDGALVVEGFGARLLYDIVAFGPHAKILREHGLDKSPVGLDLKDIAREIRVSRMLGEGWNVTRINGFAVIQHEDSPSALLLRDR